MSPLFYVWKNGQVRKILSGHIKRAWVVRSIDILHYKWLIGEFFTITLSNRDKKFTHENCIITMYKTFNLMNNLNKLLNFKVYITG